MRSFICSAPWSGRSRRLVAPAHAVGSTAVTDTPAVQIDDDNDAHAAGLRRHVQQPQSTKPKHKKAKKKK